MRVGFIGLGRMGRGMAHRLHGGRHDLVVHDVVKAAGDDFVKAGAKFADTVADLCAGREVVVTMLVEDAAVLDVAMRPGGLCASMPSGAIHVAMGTYGVGAIRALGEAHAKAGQVLVAAPVLDVQILRGVRATGHRLWRTGGRRRARAATARSHGPEDVSRRRVAGVGDRDQAREQYGPRLRDGRDGRRVLADSQVRRRAADVLRA